MGSVIFAVDADHTDLVQGDRDLRSALEERGHTVDVGVWDDRSVRWTDYDLVLVRETWDYEKNYETFLRWVEHLEEIDTLVMNPPDVLRWNAKKQYLKDFQESSVPIPPSFFVPEGANVPLERIMDEKGWDEVVVKPLVGAGAHNLDRFDRSSLDAGQKHLGELVAEHGAIVQKYLPEVTGDGEWSFLFVGKELSHTVRKTPAEGDYRVQRALGATRHHEEADPAVARQAKEYAKTITKPFLYLRMDGIVHNDRLLVVEMEMIEPRLYLEGTGEGVENFAEAIDGVIEDGLHVDYFETAAPSQMNVDG